MPPSAAPPPRTRPRSGRAQRRSAPACSLLDSLGDAEGSIIATAAEHRERHRRVPIAVLLCVQAAVRAVVDGAVETDERGSPAWRPAGFPARRRSGSLSPSRTREPSTKHQAQLADRYDQPQVANPGRSRDSHPARVTAPCARPATRPRRPVSPRLRSRYLRILPRASEPGTKSQVRGPRNERDRWSTTKTP